METLHPLYHSHSLGGSGSTMRMQALQSSLRYNTWCCVIYGKHDRMPSAALTHLLFSGNPPAVMTLPNTLSPRCTTPPYMLISRGLQQPSIWISEAAAVCFVPGGSSTFLDVSPLPLCCTRPFWLSNSRLLNATSHTVLYLLEPWRYLLPHNRYHSCLYMRPGTLH